MRDRELLEIVICQHSKVGRVIDRHNSGTSFTNTCGIFTAFVHLEAVRIVFVVTHTDIFFSKPSGQPFEQGGFADTRKTRKA